MEPYRLYPNHTHYHSYLLRIWQAGAKGAPALRILLVSPHSNQRWSFTSMQELVEFLEEEIGDQKEDKRE